MSIRRVHVVFAIAAALPDLCSLSVRLPAQTFEVLATPMPASSPMHLAVGDVDADGLPDIAMAGFGSVQVARGDGSGHFRAGWTQRTWWSDLVALGDANGDGRLDLLVSDLFGPLYFVGDAKGGFVQSPWPIPGNGAFVLVDLDEDQVPDFVVEDVGQVIYTAINDNAGGLRPWTLLTQSTNFSFGEFRVGDVNQDGHVDVVTRGSFGATIFVGDGAGHLTQQQYLPVGYQWAGWTLTDVDADGIPDLVLGAEVWRNNGLGTFSLVHTLTGVAHRRLEAADMDGDGLVDLVTNDGTSIAVYPGLGSGVFGPPTTTATGVIHGLAVADFDLDGFPDIVTLAQMTNEVLVLRRLTPVLATGGVFGTGTPGCAGYIGIQAMQAPVIGQASFRVQCTNVPRVGVGIMLVGVCTPGRDAFGLGLTLYVDHQLPFGWILTDRSGVASFELPIPAGQQLQGLTFCVQSVWVGNPGIGESCSTAQFEFMSSRGLSLRL